MPGSLGRSLPFGNPAILGGAPFGSLAILSKDPWLSGPGLLRVWRFEGHTSDLF